MSPDIGDVPGGKNHPQMRTTDLNKLSLFADHHLQIMTSLIK